MTKYIALLRGINVSGQKKIKMADLRGLLTDRLGFENVVTYIQSGNIVFESSARSISDIEKKIAQEILNAFGFEVPVLVKTSNQLKTILENNPYQEIRPIQENRIYYVLLKEVPTPEAIAGMEAMEYTNEEFSITGECVYLKCLTGYGQAKLNNNLLERKLKVQATTRNHRTMLKLLELGSESH